MKARAKIDQAIAALMASFQPENYSSQALASVELGIDFLKDIADQAGLRWQDKSQENKDYYSEIAVQIILSATILLALAQQQEQDMPEISLTRPEASPSSKGSYPIKLGEIYEDLREKHDSECNDKLETCEACNKQALWALGKKIRTHQYSFNANLLRELLPQPQMAAELDSLQSLLDKEEYQRYLARRQHVGESQSRASENPSSDPKLKPNVGLVGRLGFYSARKRIQGFSHTLNTRAAFYFYHTPELHDEKFLGVTPDRPLPTLPALNGRTTSSLD